MATPLQFLLYVAWSFAATVALIAHAMKIYWPGLFRIWTLAAVALSIAFCFQRLSQ